MSSLTTPRDITDLEIIRNKNVLISDTSNNPLAFHLAHVIRHSARVTYCVGADYEIRENLMGFRILEEGKVVLIRGDLELERERIYDIVKYLQGTVEYEINIRKVK
jgi:hypothetical protein